MIDETRDIVDIARNIAYFFRHESCGKCTPCRIGTEQMYKIIDRISRGKGNERDLDTLERLGKDMKLTSFCPLGQTASSIIVESIKKFRDEWIEYIEDNIEDKKAAGGSNE